MRRMIDPKELNQGGGEGGKTLYQHNIRIEYDKNNNRRELYFSLITSDKNEYTINEIMNVLKKNGVYNNSDPTNNRFICANGTGYVYASGIRYYYQSVMYNDDVSLKCSAYSFTVVKDNGGVVTNAAFQESEVNFSIIECSIGDTVVEL